jgi:hypothetical protein
MVFEAVDDDDDSEDADEADATDDSADEYGWNTIDVSAFGAGGGGVP